MRYLSLLLLMLLVNPMSALARMVDDRQPAESIFRLCQGNVAEVALVEEAAGVSVHVRLTEEAARAFAELTQHRQGQVLVVLVGEKVFARAVPQATVESGRLRSSALSVAEAAELSQMMRVPQVASGCGGEETGGVAQQGAAADGYAAAELSR